MDELFVLGQLVCLGALAYGAWICLVHAGKYDAESLRLDDAVSRTARARGHAETACDLSECQADVRRSGPAPDSSLSAPEIFR